MMREDRKIELEEKLVARREGMGQRPPLKRGQEKPEKSWFWKLSLAFLGLSILIWAWAKLTNPVDFPIRNVKIEGNYSKVDRTAIREAILAYTQDGFWRADVSGLQDRLSQLSWVYSAKVQRVWPDGLAVILAEQQPVASYGNGLLVNEQGDLFKATAATIPQGLPVFAGPDGQQKLMLAQYQQMSVILKPLGLKIAELDMDLRQSWQLKLSNDITLFLGRDDPLIRVQRFAASYSQIIASRAASIQTVDLRYTNGMAVVFKNQSTAI